MIRVLSVCLGLCLLILGSCTQRMICPAYQSAFIYDKDELRKKFSYFLDDSTPKVYTASKNKYLVAEPTSYQKRLRAMQTVRLKPVPVVVPDSLTSDGIDSVSMDEMRRATQSVIDSTVIIDVPRDTVATEPLDSVYVISKDKELRLLKYNMPDSLDYDSATQRYVKQNPKYYVEEVRYQMEQDNYMWYLRDNLVLPDVRIAKMGLGGEQGGSGKSAAKKEKKGLKGFFKNLFKKKSKEEADTTKVPVQTEEFDYVDEADTTMQAEIPQPGQEKKAEPVQEEEKPKKKKRERAPRNRDAKPEDTETAPAGEEKKEGDDGF
jgi:hypothetical protein